MRHFLCIALFFLLASTGFAKPKTMTLLERQVHALFKKKRSHKERKHDAYCFGLLRSSQEISWFLDILDFNGIPMGHYFGIRVGKKVCCQTNTIGAKFSKNKDTRYSYWIRKCP